MAMDSITSGELLDFIPFFPLSYSKEKNELKKIIQRQERWTALEILEIKGILREDKLGIVLRIELVSAHKLQEFACRCAERALARIDNPDPRSLAAISARRTMMKYRQITEDFEAVEDAAWEAAHEAGEANWEAIKRAEAIASAWRAAGDAAKAAAKAATEAAEWAAGREAEWWASWDASQVADSSALSDARYASARAAAYAAASAAAQAAEQAAEQAAAMDAAWHLPARASTYAVYSAAMAAAWTISGDAQQASAHAYRGLSPTKKDLELDWQIQELKKMLKEADRYC